MTTTVQSNLYRTVTRQAQGGHRVDDHPPDGPKMSGSIRGRHDVRDGRVAIKDRTRLTASYSTEVFTKPGLQFGDPHLLHHHHQ